MRGFNPDLPSGRRRLFLLILLVFMVVGFGTRYLLIGWGWGQQEDAPSSDPLAKTDAQPGPTSEKQPSQSDSPVTADDREEAQPIAKKFVEAYLAQGPKEKAEFLKEADPWMTDSLQSEIEEDPARPVGPVKVQSTEATEVQDYQREQSGQVVWNVWATVPKENGTYEVVYEVILSQEKGDWLVQEVNQVEYPELGGE